MTMVMAGDMHYALNADVDLTKNHRKAPCFSYGDIKRKESNKTIHRKPKTV